MNSTGDLIMSGFSAVASKSSESRIVRTISRMFPAVEAKTLCRLARSAGEGSSPRKKRASFVLTNVAVSGRAARIAMMSSPV